ncbi:PTS glucose transporter subunit IIB, partial [Staphylococcus agnetis]|uniref:glucose PTS transporter subunit EIIB n=1 Tax=Staphylococcus agnetis TaxID=985762 RepID=UPI001431B9DB
IFKLLIIKMNFKTPGREAEQMNVCVDKSERAQTIIEALGGKANINVVDCCATRLRVTLYDSGKLNESQLKMTEAKGVIKQGNGVQIVYGPHVTSIKNEIEEQL